MTKLKFLLKYLISIIYMYIIYSIALYYHSNEPVADMLFSIFMTVLAYLVLDILECRFRRESAIRRDIK